MKLLTTLSLLCLLIGSKATAQTDTLYIRYSQNRVTISPETKGVSASINGAQLKIKSKKSPNPLVFYVEGESNEGKLIFKGSQKAEFHLKGLKLKSPKGAALDFTNKYEQVTLIAEKGTTNSLEGTADSTRRATLYSKGRLKLCGKGTLNVTNHADGMKGIEVKDSLDISELTLNVETTGDNMGVDTTKMAPPPFMMPPHEEGKQPAFPNQGGLSPMAKNTQTRRGMPQSLPEGEFHGFPPRNMPDGKFPEGPSGEMPEGGFPGGPFPGGKQKYKHTTKGIKASGEIVIESGKVNVVTHTLGAEGIEGKTGIIIRGGKVNVNAMDDGMKSSGKIMFAGGDTFVLSQNNDAVDSNCPEVGAISITGGNITALAAIGSPEEGLDCDFSPIVLEKGRVLSLGGSMGGEMENPASKIKGKQTWQRIDNIQIGQAGKTLVIKDSKGNILQKQNIPFTLRGGNCLFSFPEMKKKETCTISLQ